MKKVASILVLLSALGATYFAWINDQHKVSSSPTEIPCPPCPECPPAAPVDQAAIQGYQDEIARLTATLEGEKARLTREINAAKSKLKEAKSDPSKYLVADLEKALLQGQQALYSNTTGNYNTAQGYQALYSNTTGGTYIGRGVIYEPVDKKAGFNGRLMVRFGKK